MNDFIVIPVSCRKENQDIQKFGLFKLYANAQDKIRTSRPRPYVNFQQIYRFHELFLKKPPKVRNTIS